MKSKIIKFTILLIILILTSTLKGMFTGSQNVLNLTYQEIKLNEVIDLIYNVFILIILIFGTYKIIGGKK